MKLTSAFSIPCPDDDDTGAMALYMESLARKIDTEIQTQYDELTSFFTPPTAIFNNGFTDTYNPGAEVIIFALFASGLTYSKLPAGVSATKLSVPGWYAAGGYIRTVANATITDNSAIHFHIDVNSYDIAPGEKTRLARFTTTSYESSTGGEPQVNSGTFYIPPGVTAELEGVFYHNNAGTRSLAANSKAWYTWIGTGDVTAKVEF